AVWRRPSFLLRRGRPPCSCSHRDSALLRGLCIPHSGGRTDPLAWSGGNADRRRILIMALLELKNLHVALEAGTEIVRVVELAVNTNETHAVMGPNGSGKSTLAYALMGHPAYEITEGELLLEGENVVEMEADERARRGLFLAFQYPHAIPGVTVTSFLRSALNAIRKARAGGEDDPIPIPEFRDELTAAMEELKVSRELASRYVNDGFS